MSKVQEETKVDQTIKKPTEPGFEVFVKSLPFSSTTDEIEQFFGSCGTVENVNLLRTRDGRPKGIGFVRFATKDQAQKAIGLNGKDFGGRTLVVELAQPKSDRPEGEPRQPRVSNSIFVGNLAFSTTEGDLRKFFEGTGAIKAIRLANDRDGNSKGFAHIDFEDSEGAQNAVKKTGAELDGRNLRVDFANPERRDGGFRGGRGGFRGGRGGRGGFGGGFRGPREGGFREGGYREGGNREGGFREGGYREGGNREGGFREGGFRGGRGGQGGPRRNDRA